MNDGEPDYGSVMFFQSCRLIEFSTKFDYVILKSSVRDSFTSLCVTALVSIDLEFTEVIDGKA